MKIVKFIPLVFVLMCLFASCKNDDASTNFTLSSTAFAASDSLPQRYTCDGLSYSPPLNWENIPKKTKSLAITMHHVPGPGDKHVYLVMYNIPATTESIPENVSGVGLFGINTVNGQTSYTPPCSQGPGTKLYTMTIYALSSAPNLPVPQTSVSMDTLLQAITDITLDTAMVNCTYTR